IVPAVYHHHKEVMLLLLKVLLQRAVLTRVRSCLADADSVPIHADPPVAETARTIAQTAARVVIERRLSARNAATPDRAHGRGPPPDPAQRPLQRRPPRGDTPGGRGSARAHGTHALAPFRTGPQP